VTGDAAGPQVIVADGHLGGRPGGIGAGATVPLPPEVDHHLRRVLRLADGAAVRLTDGAGRVAAATLRGAAAVLAAAPADVPRPAPRLALVQALTRGRRADDAVRTACELGVDLVVPLVAARTQGRPGAAEREALVGRWRAVAAAALAQSRGAWAAAVAPCTDVDGLVAVPPWEGPRYVAVPGAPALPERLAASAPPAETPAVTLGIAVGPEGGWTPDEVARLVDAGWAPAGLGPTVLRSEHAGASGRWAAEG
jgi:16S rRNA (uracil1498-N3)-methyltransferase